MKQPLLILLFFFTCTLARTQTKLPQIKLLQQGSHTSLRGLSVVNDRVVWVSGSNGTIGKSTDGGETWKWLAVKGFEKRDFRDIEAFDATTAVIIAVDTPAAILRTIDGGSTWKLVYQNKTPGMFLDALEFWNDQAGIVVGDPVNGKFFIARTFDGGEHWKEIPEPYKPVADSGEACFAASGTNVRVLDRDEAIFVSGGVTSHAFIRNQAIALPIVQGKATTGANSIAVMDWARLKGGTTMIVVGGDFNADSSAQQNCFYSTDRGKIWMAPKTPPHGYRSCVEYLSKKQVIACGTTGVDYSFDGGKNWKLISNEGFHVCRIAKQGAAVFLAGANGRIAKVVYRKNSE